MVPVHQGIVEANAQSFGARGLHILADQIPARTLLGRAVVSQLCVEIAEAFMVLGGHHHVFLPGLPGELRPLARGVGLGLELFGELSYSGIGMPSFSIAHS